jgi:hypothetical protein
MSDELSARAQHCLAFHLRNDFYSDDIGIPIRPEEAAALSRRLLLLTPQLGQKTMKEIEAWLHRHGQRLRD